MGLADTVELVRTGVFNIVYLDKGDRRLGSGTGFASCGFLITNHHVFMVPQDCRVWIRREMDVLPCGGLILTGAEFRKRLKSGSTEDQYDFAILDIPEILGLPDVHNFKLSTPENYRIGDTVAFLGYPSERENLTCHAGVISSFFDDPPARVIQLDASVNPSNSGGPLFDTDSGVAIGIVTRRATGLTRSFASLRDSVKSTLKILKAAGSGIFMNQVPLLPTLASSQQHILTTLDELERQANVGIGFAFSIEHLMDDNIVYGILHPEAQDTSDAAD